MESTIDVAGTGPAARVSAVRTAAVLACILACLATGWTALGVDTATAKAPAGRTFFVDCATGKDGASGTTAKRPWRTLAKAGKAALRPGDSLLFKRSTRCRGVLEPHRSGTKSRPIVVGAYGKGSRPVLDGAGARAVIVLHDVQGWTIRGLAIRNPGPVAEVGVLRSAIQIENDGLTVASGFVVEDNVITDVATSKVAPEGTNAINYGKDSGGILFKAAADKGFADVLVARNRLEDVAREGIVVRGGTLTKRLTIRGNTLKRIQGDGVVVVRASKALVERNVLDGFNTRGIVSNAGMWAYHSTDVTFQFNTVSHGANGDLDGTAYDIDGGNERLVFQYNLSRENAGGFLMMCGDQGTQSGHSIVRYNVSQDDALSEQGVVRAPPCGNEQDIQIYNNTIFTSDPSGKYLLRNVNGSSLVVRNNLFVSAAAPALVEDSWSIWDTNLFANVSCRFGLQVSHGMVGDPRFVAPGKATSLTTAGGYRLRQGSPALAAGVVIPGNGGRDFFGNKVSATARPNLGAYQGPGAAPAGGPQPVTAPGCAS